MTPAPRWARFVAVSTAGFGLQLATVASLTTWTGVADIAATAAGVAAAVIHNFAWHVRWTWADREAVAAERVRAFARFAAANGAVSLVGNVALVAVLAGAAGVDVVLSNVVAVAASSVVNYRLADGLVFRRRRIPRPPTGSSEPYAPHSDRRGVGGRACTGLFHLRARRLSLARSRRNPTDARGRTQ
jgi:putative flippase GtrA